MNTYFPLLKPRIWGKTRPPFFDQMLIYRYEAQGGLKKTDDKQKKTRVVYRRKSLELFKDINIDEVLAGKSTLQITDSQVSQKPPVDAKVNLEASNNNSGSGKETQPQEKMLKSEIEPSAAHMKTPGKNDGHVKFKERMEGAKKINDDNMIILENIPKKFTETIKVGNNDSIFKMVADDDDVHEAVAGNDVSQNKTDVHIEPFRILSDLNDPSQVKSRFQKTQEPSTLRLNES